MRKFLNTGILMHGYGPNKLVLLFAVFLGLGLPCVSYGSYTGPKNCTVQNKPQRIVAATAWRKVDDTRGLLCGGNDEAGCDKNHVVLAEHSGNTPFAYCNPSSAGRATWNTGTLYSSNFKDCDSSNNDFFGHTHYIKDKAGKYVYFYDLDVDSGVKILHTQGGSTKGSVIITGICKKAAKYWCVGGTWGTDGQCTCSGDQELNKKTGKCETVQQEPGSEKKVTGPTIINNCQYNKVNPANVGSYYFPYYVTQKNSYGLITQVATCNSAPSNFSGNWNTCQTEDIIFRKADSWDTSDAFYYCTEDKKWQRMDTTSLDKQCDLDEYNGWQSFNVQGGACYYKLKTGSSIAIENLHCCATPQPEEGIVDPKVQNTCAYNNVDYNEELFKLPLYIYKQTSLNKYQVASCNVAGGPIPQALRSEYSTTPWQTCVTGNVVLHKGALGNPDILYYCDEDGWKIVDDYKNLQKCSSDKYAEYQSVKVKGGTCYYKLNADNITVDINSINCCQDDQCPVGQKDDYKYFICNSDADCKEGTLPANAAIGKCQNVGRKCSVCVATECADGFEIVKNADGVPQGYCQPANPQQFTITGKILGKENNGAEAIALTGVNVTIRYTNGSVEQEIDVSNGTFKLQVNQNTDVTFSAEGYEDQTCTAKQADSCAEIIMLKVQEEIVAQEDDTTLGISGLIFDSTETEKANRLEIRVTINYHNGSDYITDYTSDGIFSDLIVKKDSKMKFSAEGYKDAYCIASNIGACNEIIMTKDTTNEPVVPETPDTDPEKIKKAEEAEAKYKAAAEKEKAGRAHSAIATGLSTAGGYMLGEAIAERRADRAAEADMKNYLAGMRCSYAGGQNVELGQTVEIPGGDELFNNYNKYKQIAERLKRTKAALNLPAGIESQVVYDKAETNLYKYTTLGARSGGEISLARALTDPNSEDAAAWAAQKEKTNTNMTIGGGLATSGLATGIIGRIAVNNKYDDDDDESEE